MNTQFKVGETVCVFQFNRNRNNGRMVLFYTSGIVDSVTVAGSQDDPDVVSEWVKISDGPLISSMWVGRTPEEARENFLSCSMQAAALLEEEFDSLMKDRSKLREATIPFDLYE